MDSHQQKDEESTEASNAFSNPQDYDAMSNFDVMELVGTSLFQLSM